MTNTERITQTRRSDWLLYVDKAGIEAQAFRDVARWIVYLGTALLVGLALVPVVMP